MSLDEPIAGLDIGTVSTRCLAVRGWDDRLEVLGYARVPSEGVFRGEIVDLEACSARVRECVRAVSAASDGPIECVFGSVPNAQCRGLNSRGGIGIARPDRVVTPSDVEKVMRAAGNIALPKDRVALHKIRGAFAVDELREVTRPNGMTGSRLEAEVHVVTGEASAVENIRRAIEKADVRVEHLVAQPLAAAMAAVTEDERCLGVLSLNLGGGTTGCALYSKDCLCFSRALPVGGNHITSDLAAGWGVSFEEAERIKLDLQDLWGTEAPSTIEAQSCAGESIRLSTRRGNTVLRARVEETFEIARRELARDGLEGIAASVVLSGQGALLHRAAARGAEAFGVPCRVATSCGPTKVAGMPAGPGWATAVGLALYGIELRKQVHGDESADSRGTRLARRFWEWLKDF